jgi:NusA-like KH domain protein
MVNTINMQDMRYINLFGKITRVDTRFCVKYNDTLIFAVPRSLISKSIGENGNNIRQMREITGKKIKVIPMPNGDNDIKEFISAIISPIKYKELEMTENEIIINAGMQSKAALIGRNRRRELELQKIAKDYFKRDLRII